MDDKKLSTKSNIIYCVISVIVLVVLLFPLFWTLITSFKTEKEIFMIPPTWYPHEINTKSYAAQIENGDFNMFRSFFNSFVISVSSMLIAVVLAVPASYSIARYKFVGRKAMLLGFLGKRRATMSL